jgi:membrane protease YdiL (CAAX protease family)
LEEIVYRGLLVQVCFLLPGAWWRGLALAATILFFCLSHLQFGWSQVAAKAPLALVAMAAALSTGSVLSAVAVHVVFNVEIWRGITDAPALERGVRSRGGGGGIQSRGLP